MTEYKYDLAISLLDEDAHIGWEIVNKIGNPDKIFFYKKDADEIVFTNGVNTFGDIFSNLARFVLVLHRDNYGTTDWTAVEYSIIQTRFKRTIKTNNSPILFCKLDSSANPTWLPETYIYGNIDSLDDLVKLIRKRITDFGGNAFPQTAEEKLKLGIAKRNYEEAFNRKVFHNQELAEEARREADILKNLLLAKLEHSATDNQLFFKNNTKYISSNVPIATLNVIFDSITISLRDHQVATNSIEGAYIEIEIAKSDRKLKSYKKKFYITNNKISGWRNIDDSNFQPTNGLVEAIFHDIVNIVSR
jgi:hypothetical protein